MSKEQIEKIAAILLETSRQNSIYKSNNKSYTVFDADTIFKYGCDRLNGASAIYNAGYREQSEVIIEFVEKVKHIAEKCVKFRNSEEKQVFIEMLEDVAKMIIY